MWVQCCFPWIIPDLLMNPSDKIRIPPVDTAWFFVNQNCIRQLITPFSWLSQVRCNWLWDDDLWLMWRSICNFDRARLKVLKWIACLCRWPFKSSRGEPRIRRHVAIPLEMLACGWCGGRRVIWRHCRPTLVKIGSAVVSHHIWPELGLQFSGLQFFPVDWAKPFMTFDVICSPWPTS